MSANFTPTQTAIADLRPFKMWCQKVLPAIYDESLSYYELLCKVVNYLNQNIDDINTLNDNVNNIYDAYVLLQDYVNDFFDQNFPQLVSDKLDEMAEDGTLTDLISNYVDPLFQAKSAQVDSAIQTQNTAIENAIAQQNTTIDTAITTQNSSIDLMESRLTNFVSQHAGLNNETVLLNIGSNLLGWTGKDTYIAWDGDPSEFNYVEIHWRHKGNICINKFRGSDVVSANGVELHDTYINGTSIERVRIKIVQEQVGNQTQYKLAVCQTLDGNGTSTDLQANNTETYIYRVVGIKDAQNDQEVLDIRVGADGTIYPSAGDAVRDQIDELKNQINSLEAIPYSVKTAMDNMFAHALYNDYDASSAYATFHLWVTARSVVSISAVFTQGANVVYTNDPLDSLKQYLVVTASFSDSTTATLASADYTLSGTLAEGTQTITVTYGDKTDTFTVDCTVNGWLYHFEQNLISAGAKDFGLQGNCSYGTGFDGNGYSMYNDSEATYATGFTAPDLSGDFTISFWSKTLVSKTGQGLSAYVGGSAGVNLADLGTPSNIKTGWSVSATQVNQSNNGCRVASWSSNVISTRLINSASTYGRNYSYTPPSSFDSTIWHHYAITRQSGLVRFFVDGEVIFTVSTSQTLKFPTQCAIGGYYDTSNALQTPTENKSWYDDLFVAEWCKWTSDFNPSEIKY